MLFVLSTVGIPHIIPLNSLDYEGDIKYWQVNIIAKCARERDFRFRVIIGGVVSGVTDITLDKKEKSFKVYFSLLSSYTIGLDVENLIDTTDVCITHLSFSPK